jgi:hypothetical protein
VKIRNPKLQTSSRFKSQVFKTVLDFEFGHLNLSRI